MENKELFVKELGELLANHQVEGITGMDYKHNGSFEIVVIHFRDPLFGDEYDRTVDVTMDSLAATVRDVMKALY